MNYRILFGLFLLSMVFINACNNDDDDLGPAPVACMELSKNEILVGESITVTDCSENANNIEIYFGDKPFLSKDNSATYTYDEAGTYTVTLIAYPIDARNDVSTVTEEVTVIAFTEGQEPNPCFDYRNQLNLEVLFINCTENASSFEWDFGDGNVGTGYNPTHTYAAAGTYTVVLRAFAPGSTDAVELEQEVIVELVGDPEACFEASNVAVAPDEEISFLNCSKNSFRFAWDFGDGATSTQINPTHSYEESGTYEVELMAFAADGSFSDSEILTINVGERFLTGFRLVSFPALNESGETWDPQLPFPLPIDGIGPEPDVTLAYKREFDASYNNTSIEYDIKSSSLPYEWELASAIKMYEDSWEFVLNDDEGFFGVEEMRTWSGTLNDKGNNGIIRLDLDGAVIEVLYEIR